MTDLTEQLANAIPTELTATPHVGVGSARRLKIAQAVLSVVEDAIEQARVDERRLVVEQIRAIPDDDGPFHTGVRKFIDRHARLVEGTSIVAVLLAVADEIEGTDR